MAFSLRKMLSNITYFAKPGENDGLGNTIDNKNSVENGQEDNVKSFLTSENIEFDHVDNDLTSKCVSLVLPESLKNFTAKKGSLSDTDLLNFIDTTSKQDKKKCRKLKVDLKKASQSLNESVNYSEDSSINVENTPKHKLLDCKSAELFKNFNFNQSFDMSDAESVACSIEDEMDIESLSDHSDTDLSREHDEVDIKMCRKVEPESQPVPLPSVTPESFADLEVDKNEEERITLLLNYQMKLEKMECFLKKLLTEFEFHIEVSKIFHCKSIVTALPGTNVANLPKALGEVTSIDNIQRGMSPAGWNIIMEKEDTATKSKLKNQLQTMKYAIDKFINTYLQENKPKLSLLRSKTYEVHNSQNRHKKCYKKKSYKKKIKHFDFPDLRDAMLKLFSIDESDITSSEMDDHSCSKCMCQCHVPSDCETIIKSDNTPNQSITSSIGNFTLDSTTLSAYSESLDQIVSYNSFNETNNSLYNTLLQKAAMERITFYIQVHSIQLKCEPSELDFESKNVISFHCPACKITEYEENSLLKHILSPSHCEKIHFVYKTAYVKKCINSGKEIQPSTVLNAMTMYRDDNKIVCFGDAMYACSLCFENLICGESVLMSHCADVEHINRRELLSDIFD